MRARGTPTGRPRIHASEGICARLSRTAPECTQHRGRTARAAAKRAEIRARTACHRSRDPRPGRRRGRDGRPAPVRVTDLAYDARAVAPGSLFVCVPGQRADGHDFAADCGRRRSRGARRRARARPERAAARRRGRARRDGAGRGRVLRPADARARGRGRDGHEREDDDGVPALLDPRRRRPPSRPARHGRDADRRRAARGRPHDARGHRPPAHVPRDARRGRPELRHGGVLARVRAQASRRHAFPGPRLHEPDPGPPGLPRDDGARTTRPSVVSSSTRTSTETGRPRPSTSATSTDGVSPRSCEGWAALSSPSAWTTTPTFGLTASSSRRRPRASARPVSRCARGFAAVSTSRTSWERSPPRACSASRTTRSSAASSTWPAFPGVSRRSTRGSRLPCSSTTRTRRRRWRTCSPRRAT